MCRSQLVALTLIPTIDKADIDPAVRWHHRQAEVVQDIKDLAEIWKLTMLRTSMAGQILTLPTDRPTAMVDVAPEPEVRFQVEVLPGIMMLTLTQCLITQFLRQE